MTASLPGIALPIRTILRAGMLLLLLSATVLERFGINAGAASTSLALIGGYAFLACAGLARALSISWQRLLLYGVCLSGALASSLFNDTASSFPSLLLLAAMYLPFIFALEPGSLAQDDGEWVLARFSDIAFLCAAAGILQFAAQPFIHADWLFDFTPYIPEKLRAAGTFNTVIPMGSFNKSNGFFFREPSGFSFLMALAVLVEAFHFKRKPRIACFGLALLLTYSGTGILALLLGTLHPFGAKTLLRLGIVACAGALVFWLLGDALNLSFTLERVAEFNSTHSSAYMRYVAPARLVTETIDSSWWAPWLGHGPGTIFRIVRPYEFHDPTWAKLLFEYGGFGFIAFITLFLTTLRRPQGSAQVRAALFWGWLIMGGHLLSPEQNWLTLALIGLMPVARRFSSQPDAPITALPADAGSTVFTPAVAHLG